MLYLTFRLVIIFVSLSGISLADTLIIKKYKKPSRTILDRKIIYMDMGQKPSAKTSSKSLANLSSPVTTKKSHVKTAPQKSFQVKGLESKSFKVTKLGKKSRLASIGKDLSKSFGKAPASADTIGEYNEDDWNDYAEYIELEESLSVNAKIKKHN